MAVEANNVRDARDDAEAQFTIEQVAMAKPLLDAFHFKILELVQRSHDSAASYHAKRMDLIDKEIAGLGFDGEPTQ